MILTGSNGQLKLGSNRIAKCRSFTVQIDRDAVETTTIGSYDREYTKGVRGGTGSASIFYDSTDAAAKGFFSNALDDSDERKTLSLILDSRDGRKIEARGFVTSMSAAVSVGEATAMDIKFQFSGPITGVF